MKYSNTAIRELSAKYRSILKKCAFLNALVLISAVANPVLAEDLVVTNGETVSINSSTEEKEITYSDIDVKGTLNISATQGHFNDEEPEYFGDDGYYDNALSVESTGTTSVSGNLNIQGINNEVELIANNVEILDGGKVTLLAKDTNHHESEAQIKATTFKMEKGASLDLKGEEILNPDFKTTADEFFISDSDPDIEATYVTLSGKVDMVNADIESVNYRLDDYNTVNDNYLTIKDATINAESSDIGMGTNFDYAYGAMDTADREEAMTDYGSRSVYNAAQQDWEDKNPGHSYWELDRDAQDEFQKNYWKELSEEEKIALINADAEKGRSQTTGNLTIDHSKVNLLGGCTEFETSGNIVVQNESEIELNPKYFSSVLAHEGHDGNISVKDSKITLNGNSSIIRGYYDWEAFADETQYSDKLHINLSLGDHPEYMAGISKSEGNIIFDHANLLMNGTSSIALSDTIGNIQFLDGTQVDIKGNNLISGEVSLNNSTMNIAKDAVLTTEMVKNEAIQKGIINLDSQSNINLFGKLQSNVDGLGTLNINDSKAQVIGDISGVNLSINSDFSTEGHLNGVVNDLDKLLVSEGKTLNLALTDALTGGTSGHTEDLNARVITTQSGSTLNIICDKDPEESNKDLEASKAVDIRGDVNLTNAGLKLDASDLDDGIFDVQNSTIVADDADIIARANKDMLFKNTNITLKNRAGIEKVFNGDLNIENSTIDLVSYETYGGSIEKRDSWEERGPDSPTGDINIKNSTVTMGKNSYILRGDFEWDYKPLLDTVATGNGNINVDHSVINMNDNSMIAMNNLGSTGAIKFTNGSTLNINGTNQLKGSTILSASTLNLGNKTLEIIGGNLDIQDGSIVNFQVSGKDNFGKVIADNITVSNTDTVLNLTLDTGVLAKGESKDFQILKVGKDGTITGDFAKLSENARYEFKSLGNGKYLITGVATAGDVIVDAGGDTNTQKAAEAWLDNGTFAPDSAGKKVADILQTLSANPAAFKKAVEALKPDTAPTAQATASAVNNQIAGAVAGRFGGPAPQGHSAGDTFKNAGLWAQGLMNKSKLDKSNGFDGKTNGLAMGIDGEVAKGLKIGMGYAYTTSDIDATGRNTDVDTHTGILYAEKALGNAFVNGVLTYGRSSYKEDKNVGGLGVSADYDADAIFTQLMTGYTFGNSNWTLTPETGVRYLWTKTHAYTDTADQHVASNTTDTWTGVLGARTSFPIQVKSMTFVPELKLAATYDIKNDKAGSFVTLANGSSYATTGEALNRFGVETGAKLSTTVGNTEWSLNYEGKFRKDYTDHTGMVNFKYNF